MNKFENYLRTFAADLRSKGLAEPIIADVLNEIASDPSVDPENPESTLGTPKALASGYESKRTRSAGFKIFLAAGVAALAITGIKVFTSLILDIQTGLLVTVLTYAIAIAVLIVGIAIAARVDRRLPADLEKRLRA